MLRLLYTPNALESWRVRLTDITDEHFLIIRDRMLPQLNRRGKQRTKIDVLSFLVQAWPQRLDFEIARLNGLGFDSGEAGFSHTVES